MPRASNRFFDRVERFAVDVILERRWGLRASLSFRYFLWLLSGLYRQGVRCRLWWYENRLGSVHALGCLVISVGNLTVGGTGKTPVVELFALRADEARGARSPSSAAATRASPRRFRRSCSTSSGRSTSAIRRGSSPTGRSILLDSDLAGDEPFIARLQSQGRACARRQGPGEKRALRHPANMAATRSCSTTACSSCG